MSDDSLDQLARLRAAFDQMLANLPELAQAAHAYRVAMLDAGFSEAEAFALTRDWVRGMLFGTVDSDE